MTFGESKMSSRELQNDLRRAQHELRKPSRTALRHPGAPRTAAQAKMMLSPRREHHFRYPPWASSGLILGPSPPAPRILYWTVLRIRRPQVRRAGALTKNGFKRIAYFKNSLVKYSRGLGAGAENQSTRGPRGVPEMVLSPRREHHFRLGGCAGRPRVP